MGRKKRQSYIPYDYEAAYTDQLAKMSEQEIIDRCWKKEKVIYATKEIRSGDQLELEIYPEYTRQQAGRIPTEAMRQRNRKARQNLNEKNSRKMCERVINTNFTDRDIWATFTYDQDHVPGTFEEATRNIQNYIRRLNAFRKKKGLPSARYVYTTELSDKGRYHHHIVLDGDISMDDVHFFCPLPFFSFVMYMAIPVSPSSSFRSRRTWFLRPFVQIRSTSSMDMSPSSTM